MPVVVLSSFESVGVLVRLLCASLFRCLGLMSCNGMYDGGFAKRLSRLCHTHVRGQLF